MKLIENILTKNPCYTSGRKITVKGLMLHSVGCPQPNAAVFLKNWNKPSYDNACVHAFIDANTGTVYQTLPWNHRGWHGGGSSNNTHIGVEMCEPACIKYTSGSRFTISDRETAKAAARRTYKAAVELFAYLCDKYNLNPLADGVIVSHSEGYRRGIATNHGDPEHLWNGLNMGYTMNGFRKDVKNAMDGGVVPEKPEEKPSGKLEPYSGYITVTYAGSDGLAYHKTPDFRDSSIAGFVRKGEVLTVVGRILVDGVYMYKTKAGWYITSASKYVKFSKTENTSKPTGNGKLEPYSGYITVIYGGSDGLAYHKTPDFKDSSIAGFVKKGTVLTVTGRILVNGVYMYKTKAGWYITSASKYVKYSKTL